jgi:hypothetical protein
MWQWLHDLSPAQATVVGTLIGSLVGFVLGFITLVGGALFNERLNRRRDDRNADLNRRRDDRLRREEQRGVATALRVELAGCRQALLTNAEKMNKDRRAGDFLMPDLAHTIRIMPEMVFKFGLLDEETIDKVTNAYLAVEQYSEQLLLLHGARLVDPERVSAGETRPAGETATGSRRLMSLSADKAPQVIALNNQHAETIKEAIDRLDLFLRGLR